MLRLSLIMTLRDWRAGQLRFLTIALALAVAALSSVNFFTVRMGAAMQRDAGQVLAADLALVSADPIAPAAQAEAGRRGLRAALTTELSTMAMSGDGARLVSLKAVGPGYPLRGALQLDSGSAAGSIPVPGTAWCDAALAGALDLALGATIQVGERHFRLTRIIAAEPDRGPSVMALAPRLMIGRADLAATGLVDGAVRAEHRLLLAGEPHAVAGYQAWAKNQGVRIETPASAAAGLLATLEHAERFLALVGLISAMLASVAVAMAARRFMQRHADGCAVLRCLGMGQNRMCAMLMIEFVLVGLAASALGVAGGFAAHFVLLEWLGALLTSDLPPAGWAPALQGVAAGLVLLTGFALPQVLKLRNVPPRRLLQRGVEQHQPVALAAYAIAAAAFLLLLLWQARDLQLGLLTAGAFAGAALIFALAARAALACLRWVPARRGALRLALADMQRRPGAAATQIVALAFGLMALLLLSVVRGDLLAAWKASSPPDAPTHVLVNIEHGQRTAMQARLAVYGNPPLYAAIRGRSGEREIEMGTMAALPPANSILQGAWFRGAGEVSVAEGPAERFGIKLGDRMTVEVAGQALTLNVTSIRKVDWRSRLTNFAYIIDPASAAGLPSTLVTSVHAPGAALQRLPREFPNVSVIDMGAMIATFQRVLAQVMAAVQFLFLFTLACGVLVLVATLAAGQEERMRQAALLRALGASRRQLAHAQRIESALTGALAGLLAASGASAAAWALARFVFNLPWQASPLLFAAGMLAGAACASLGGWAGLRSVFSLPPLASLCAA